MSRICEPSRSAGWFRGGAVGCAVVLVCFLAMEGCAGTPRWVGGIHASDYYYQGVGKGVTISQAEQDALFRLCADINEIDVKAVVEDFKQEKEVAGSGQGTGSKFESDFKQWVSIYTSGKVPAETKISEHWEGKGQYWAYAVVEKPGQQRLIRSRYEQAMAGVKVHAFVPGWAQLQKKQPRRASIYISGLGAGILGGISFALLSNDAVQRRDRARTRIERNHYDQLANQQYWISTGCYALAGGMYLLNVLDGITTVVGPHRVLTQVGPGGAVLVLRF